MADKLVVLGADGPGRQALQAVLSPLGLQIVHPDSSDAVEAAVVVVDARTDPAAALAAVERCKAQTAPPPVLLLAAVDESPSPGAAWLAGADCYLTDPFNEAELLDFVGRLAGTAPRPT